MRWLRTYGCLLFLHLPVVLGAQEVKTVSGRIFLDNMPEKGIRDTLPPTIRIIAPVNPEGGIYHVEDDFIDVIGEVRDQGKIAFVAVNNNPKLVNETGVFVSTIKLKEGMNEVTIHSMDKEYNRTEKILKIDYQRPVFSLADRINQESRYYGLLIGIDEYDDPDLEDLANPVADAVNFSRTLINYYNFSTENVMVVKNPSRKEIILALDEMKEKVTDKDNLLIFYAGHGYFDQDAETGYWFPSDASLSTTADWFANSTLVNYIRAIKSKHTLLITDACFAGSIFASRSVRLPEEIIYDRIYEGISRKAMTSGNMTEVSDESAFIRYLLKQLEQNDKPYISSEELYSNIKQAVITNSEALPRFGEIRGVGNEGGDFIFVRKIRGDNE